MSGPGKKGQGAHTIRHMIDYEFVPERPIEPFVSLHGGYLDPDGGRHNYAILLCKPGGEFRVLSGDTKEEANSLWRKVTGRDVIEAGEGQGVFWQEALGGAPAELSVPARVPPADHDHIQIGEHGGTCGLALLKQDLAFRLFVIGVFVASSLISLTVIMFLFRYLQRIFS